MWAYYETLPQWCRESRLVRNVLFALEYYKPHMEFREKELAMNYMCAQLAPIEGELLKVITDVVNSNKIRMNN